MLGYRSFFTVADQPDLFKLVDEQLYSWMQSKRWTAAEPSEDGPVTVDDGVRAVLLADRPRDGSETRRHRFVQSTPSGRWITEITVHRDREGDGWVWLDVEQPKDRDARPPRLARDLIAVLDGRDAGQRLTAGAEIARPTDVPELVAALADPERRGLLFIAGTSTGLPLVKWKDYVADITKRTIGIAATWVLDADATELFNRSVPEEFRVRPGTIRTFRRGVDLTDPDDSIRHRFLTTDTIVRQNNAALATILWGQARDVTVTGRLPHRVERIDQRLRSKLDELIVGPTAEPTSSAPVFTDMLPVQPTFGDQAAPILNALRSALKKVIGAATLGVEQVQRLGDLALVGLRAGERSADLESRLTSLEDERTTIRDELDELRTRFEDEQTERALAEKDRTDAADEVRRLRLELQKAGLADAAWTTPRAPTDPRDEAPGNFDELITRVAELQYVRFTGNESTTRGLMDQDPLGTWAGKAWDALLALDDFGAARADGFQGSIEMYLKATPPGMHQWPANRFASDESRDVQQNDKYRRPRVLPVPTGVDPSGSVFMGAHFKIAKSGMISPRLHCLDDTGKTGKIYVGHIGPHLPTKQTN